MIDLKPLSNDAIPGALAKAERYRLLNEPGEAESICRDVLHGDPENQQALAVLLLCLTDQFERAPALAVKEARDILPRLRDDYERTYYRGLVSERRAKAELRRGTVGCGHAAYEWFREAMAWFEKAEAIRPAGNDECILRWNACARNLNRDSQLQPRPDEEPEPLMSE